MIHRADALGDVMAALAGRFGAVAMKPLRPRRHAAATRIVIRATKGSRAPLVLLPGLVLHRQGENGYTAEAEAILRGAALDMTAR
ncbi:MAG: methyltransferase, partial [Hyphomicrobiales bacterium]|nr:methyltransferase [Hyphomicrobiales bacterium]